MSKTPEQSKEVALERRRKAWALRQRFYTYEEIGKELKVTPQAVQRMLARMHAGYQRRHLEDIDRIKTEQIAEHEHLAHEAFQAWERSKAAGKAVKRKTKSLGGNESPRIDLGVMEETKDIKDQYGDPRYLDMAMKAKQAIRKIVGLDAPIKIDNRFNDFKDLSDEELQRRVVEALCQSEGEDQQESAPAVDGDIGTQE